jgi:hypothetical protein
MKKLAKAPAVLTISTSKYSFSKAKLNVVINRKQKLTESEIASTQFQGSEKYSKPSVHIDLISRDPKHIISDVANATNG